ncbi:MAG: amidohydrolase [Candidatus Palauibacterales bacterium]|nr:amidohydrolase [Candidatus Palauibacterales bacterium]MDP2482731.1 amidohydrolase [Candidatus Palauibacterales bacterium]
MNEKFDAPRGRTWVGVVLMMTLFAGCGERSADLVVVGGPVWTGDSATPWAEGLSATDGVIDFVGSEELARDRIGPSTRVIELDGRFAMPGFLDTHTHFMDGAFRLTAVDLRDADSPEELARRLAEYAEDLDHGEWIIGGDWDHERWGGQLPDRSWIDAVTPDNPVFVTRLDWHMALANSRALELAGIPEDVASPAGGEVVRDASGRLTGVFKDEAMPLIGAHIPEPTEAQRDSALRAAMRYASSLGLTGVTDMGSWADLETYERARRSGELTLRVYAFVPLSTVDSLARRVQAAGRGDAWLRIGGLKGFVDGSLGSGTALFDEPYSDEPGNSGLFVSPMDELKAQAMRADGAGLQVAIHAIGDRANRLLLDMYQEVEDAGGVRDRRYRVEHAQHLRPEDIDRFARLGVVASMQPYHAIDDGRWAERRIGVDRARTTYAFRSLLDAGAVVTFGSDWTVAPLDPLLGLYAAVTRRTLDGAHPDGWIPEQKIGVESALKAYTVDAAWAGFMEGCSGSLTPGRCADLVVLDRNPFDVDPEALSDLHVDLTVVGGQVVYSGE